ncbi:MAG: hypothetical protein JSW20_08090 [Nitrospiraceae bacterium]|nr:MAG: hypothetical protein JSW20_08090 [Nitrospiraceae bacterium]
MNNLIDPKEFGIMGKTVIEQVGKNHYAIVMSRKSRIIMADGRKLLEKFEQIKKVKSGAKLSLKTATPVCSKTIALLKNHNIYII